MSQFNVIPPYRGALNPWTPQSIFFHIEFYGENSLLNATTHSWPSGGVAIFVPFFLQQHMYVNGLYWMNGTTVAGNMDMGIFDQDGNRIFSLGPVLQSGTSARQMNIVSPPIHLWAGLYYMGMVAETGSAAVMSDLNALSTGTMIQFFGMAQAPTSYPLPLAPGLATMQQDFIPVFGITSEGTT